jgi:protease-4
VFKLWAEILQGPTRKKSTKDAVAIVYVEGPILPGRSSPSMFGPDRAAYSTPISKALDAAAADKSVKAVVLRVHSPGGSATASEIILNATKRVKAKKPFVVSMGGVAGSGGYYVACGTDTIFADNSTITASIGVVGGKLATTEMWNRIGVTWKEYQRGASAGLLSSDDVFSPAEREKLRAWMNEIYDVFKGHVTAARGNRLKKKLDEIAGGRVYTGRQALELGLVDKIGTLNDAIRHVAAQAKLKDYDVRIIPRPKNFMESLLEELSGQESDDSSVSLSASVAGRYRGLVEAALPYLERLQPHRVAEVRTALLRLSLLEDQRAVLMMPEMDFGR